jgi:hypothetical protein
MQLIYCLTNESFKSNIFYIGITTSSSILAQLVDLVNDTFLPTPYTVLFSKYVNDNIDPGGFNSLLCKIGRHIKENFYEISQDILEELFDLLNMETFEITARCENAICENAICENDICENAICKNAICENDIYENAICENDILQEKYRIFQDNIEYIIPKASECEYQSIIYTIQTVTNDIDIYYDRLKSFKNNIDNLYVYNNDDLDL